MESEPYQDYIDAFSNLPSLLRTSCNEGYQSLYEDYQIILRELDAQEEIIQNPKLNYIIGSNIYNQDYYDKLRSVILDLINFGDLIYQHLSQNGFPDEANDLKNRINKLIDELQSRIRCFSHHGR